MTTYDWNHKEAEKECKHAVELNPNDHEAQKEWAFFLNSLGREAESLVAIDKAIAIAPTSFNKRSRGLILYHSRRYDEAIAQLEQVEETDSNFKEASRWIVRSHEMNKDYGRALESYVRQVERSGGSAVDVAKIRGVYEGSGWPAVLYHMIDGQFMKNMFRAGTFAQLGDKDRAFQTLNEMRSRPAILLVTIAREPALDLLRDDPRFEELLSRMGLK